MKNILTASLIGSVLLASASALAVGAVKIECMGNCANVNLGQACDTYISGSLPVAIACDDTGPGYGSEYSCGTGGARCKSYGTLIRSDLVQAYCTDGGGYDAVVTCQ